MRDEVLQKALSTDTTVIPRYDVVKPDGTKVAENVQLVLKNEVLTPGTPLNKQNLLSDDVSRAYDLDPGTSSPNVVLASIRSSVSYCPKLKVNAIAGATLYVKNNTTNVQKTFTVPATGIATLDIWDYGTYSLWGVVAGVATSVTTVIIDTTKLYTAEIDFYATHWKFTVADEVGATIRATHADGTVVTGTVGSDKTCTLVLPKTGTWTAVGTYDNCNSSSYTLNATDAMDNTTRSTTMAWITVTVNVDTGSVVTLVSGSTTRGGTSLGGVCKVWLPFKGTWTIAATFGSSVTSGSVSATAYQNYDVTLTYFVTYGVRIPLGNSSPTSLEYTDDAVGMGTGYNAWAAQKIFKDIKPCLLLNGVVQYYLNKNNLAQKVDGTAATINLTGSGDVMIEVPKIGYRIYSDASYLYVKITDNPNAADFCYLAHSLSSVNDCDKIYYGAYLGHVNAGKLYSISGAIPQVEIALSDARTYANARGVGYGLASFYPWTLLQCIYLIMYKNMNGQSALGMGYTGQTSRRATGGADAKGPCFGETTGAHQMTFLNIEDFWGNLSIWLDGIFIDANFNIKTAYKDFNATGESYPYSQSSGFAQSVQGYAKAVQGTNSAGFILKDNNGSQTTYFCDRSTVNSNAPGYTGGTFSGTPADAGPFSMYFTQSISSAPTLGCRLVYKHVG